MNISRFDGQLEINRRASQSLGWLIFLTHTGTLAVIPNLNLPLWFRIGITCGVILSFIINMRTHIFMTGHFAITTVIWNNKDDWQLRNAKGVIHSAQLLPDKFIHPYLITLNFRLAGVNWLLARRSVILTPDSVPAADLRRLRVQLQITRGKN